MINYVAIGRRVKKFRLQANITQSTLAEKLGVSISYISQIECGTTE
ncbi:MAG: helix-turn-helix transcriptional regulator, partial [Clostridia bacterium]|nr:helix-turn-helix transcriptional regulator [Clostridia bacterium]